MSPSEKVDELLRTGLRCIQASEVQVRTPFDYVSEMAKAAERGEAGGQDELCDGQQTKADAAADEEPPTARKELAKIVKKTKAKAAPADTPERAYGGPTTPAGLSRHVSLNHFCRQPPKKTMLHVARS